MIDKIIIHDNLYLGMIWREKEVPLGFITPDTGDAASIKRKQTVDGWVKSNQGYRSTIRINTTNIKNELLSGFKLTKSQRRWTTSNVVWRIIDPRGFEIEITSENLMNLLSDTTIINGEILGRMIYGRMKGNNVLLHENSEEYILAQKMTKLNSVILSTKDLNPGNEVILHDGRELTYMGKFYPITFDATKEDQYVDEIKVYNKRVFLFIDNIKKQVYYSLSLPKIGNIKNNDVSISNDEALLQINKMVNEHDYSINNVTNGYISGSFFGFVDNAKATFKYEREYIDFDKFTKLTSTTYKIFLDTDDKFYTIRYFHPHLFTTNSNSDYINEIDFDLNNNKIKYRTYIENRRGFYSSNQYIARIGVSWATLVNPKPFYLKVIDIETNMGYDLK